MTNTTRQGGRKRESMFGLDVMPLDYCESCRRTVGTTKNSLCFGCSMPLIKDRRRFFSRSEGNGFMRQFGYANYFGQETVNEPK